MINNKTLFFNQFFEELNKSTIDYCIMNGYENYPNDIKSDIDIIVNSYNEFENILEILSKKLNYNIIQKLEHKYKVANFFIYKNGAILSLDIYEHYIVNNRLLFDNQFFLADKVKYKNFYIPHKEKEFLYYFIKKIIKQDISENIDGLFRKYEKNINLVQYFNNFYKDIQNAFENGDKNFFIKKQHLLKQDLLKSIKPNILLIYRETIRIIKRIFNPTGLTIAFLGPDGSGKSTIINLLKKEKLPFRQIHCFHLKPRILGNKGDGIPVTNPHGKEPHRGLKSYLKLIYFALDYIIGYWIKIFPLKIRSSLIIFDRYYDDILVDSKRYRYGGSIKLAKALKILIPEPDIYIILTTDPHIIYKRKVEVSFEELKRQIQEYEKLVDNKKFFKIDASLLPKQILDKIKEIILKELAKRYENR